MFMLHGQASYVVQEQCTTQLPRPLPLRANGAMAHTSAPWRRFCPPSCCRACLCYLFGSSVLISFIITAFSSLNCSSSA